ncbi:polysaccharide biosynthesis protein [Alkalitalea saponilacus]|uniref:NDP-sugar epimerase, includes UDP-GlcNAc-inverting 4,6-dehydratase FlaA1 and capsular polysaccharide biosynthesis protein EpsC n=1 Tax=Alkalitalea saponilacus TaxID=889453 RepID=A0A1T5GLJ9_9BACT|nr:nucleoside-diphosphate sugar epimerase/dehydratase [Alkalitalea saponilacus]ASB48287.1 polysaccharide biosynthesis protein [Alkalitalea saponilacus]SKC09251.1 NDP-sugar epimerase, includes UDP-GlcNAc-inverting 4,6-dehydratase FlaA1 and capsular polysaccharide biosynthesis protein EpsC [Alkalitalea saponilacus]
MKDFLLKAITRRIISPWWILLIDIMLVANAFVVSYIVRLNVLLPAYSVWDFAKGGAYVTLVYGFVFYVFRVHKGVIRHTNFAELRKLVLASVVAAGIMLSFATILRLLNLDIGLVPRLVILLHFMLAVFFCFGFRLLVRETYAYLTHTRGTEHVVIFGTDDLGLITLEAIKNDKESPYEVVGFVDDEPSKWNMTLHSLPVFSWEKLLESDGKLKHIEEVILAVSDISVKRKQKIADECLKKGWKLKVMPSVGNWVNGISNTGQIRDVRIEDLLGRDEIHLNLLRIQEGLENKTILVSGAAGSIGSEIVRQLLRFPVRQIIMLDQAESALYDLQQEIILRHFDAPFKIVLADITNYKSMRQVFETHRPHVVYNAAAYKHVPLMEDAPYEAIRVNVGGTKILADLSVEFGVEKFVMVSTDKAVNPTNVMGTSKRICEIYIQSMSQVPGIKTAFITTRFGNVLGSNGSVVPLFKRQIEQGGPITVTHPEITRYFMTIPEACQLVLEASFMGNGGEIFVFDMGEPVKIVDLAEKMVKLSGLNLGEDIDIVFTGLRPGEKLYEELLASAENTKPTHHDKIMIGKVKSFNYSEVNANVLNILELLYGEGEGLLIAHMKAMVPEFVPQNGRFKSVIHEESALT